MPLAAPPGPLWTADAKEPHPVRNRPRRRNRAEPADRRGAERARRSPRRDRRQDAIDGTSQAAGPIRRSLTASSGGAVNSSGLAPAPAFVSAALTFEGRLLRTPTAERRLAHGHEAMGATSDSRSRPGNCSPASFGPWVSLVLPYTRRRRARRPRPARTGWSSAWKTTGLARTRRARARGRHRDRSRP